MKRLAGCAALVALAAGVLASTAGASHSWNNYHWARTANPFTIKLGDNASGQWDGHLVTASSDWSQASVMDTTIVPGGTNPRKCRATSGRVEVCNSTYGFNGWLGLAQIWLSGGHIVQGVAKMNDSYFNTGNYPSTEALHVMCQEIGHTFGLGHTSEDGSSQNTCMDYYRNTSEADTTSTHPNQHDYDQLALIYQHLDGSTTIGAAEGPGNSPDWAPAGDRASVYVDHLPGDVTLVTFVYWANPIHSHL